MIMKVVVEVTIATFVTIFDVFGFEAPSAEIGQADIA
jgi:hypothetical protein